MRTILTELEGKTSIPEEHCAIEIMFLQSLGGPPAMYTKWPCKDTGLTVLATNRSPDDPYPSFDTSHWPRQVNAL